MKNCILVIDVQNGFVSDSTRHIIPRLRYLLDLRLFDVTIFSKFRNRPDSPFTKILKWEKLATSAEQAIYPALEKYASLVVTKETYSCITDSLISLLERENIYTIFLVGIDTDCCVLATALDLFQRGYLPCVLTYYCASNGGKLSHESAIIVLKRVIGEGQVIDGKVDGHHIEELMEKYKTL